MKTTTLELGPVALMILLGLGNPGWGRLSPEQERQALAISKSMPGSGYTKQALRWLSPEDREVLYLYFRDKYQTDLDAKDPVSMEEDWRLLALMGDKEALQNIVNSFIFPGDSYTDRYLQTLESPDVIPRIGDLLFRNEERVLSGDIMREPMQRRAQQIIAVTLERAPEFSFAVREWGPTVRGGEDALQSLRAWYRENESALQRGDWQAVRPGRTPKPDVVPLESGGVGYPAGATIQSYPPNQPKGSAENIAKPGGSWIPAALIAGGALAAASGLILLSRKMSAKWAK